MYKNTIYRILKSTAIIAICLAIPVSAARYYTIYVTNATPYFIDLHIVSISLEDYYESYVPPSATVTLENAGHEMIGYAHYSPGQGISGHTSKEFYGPFPQPYSTGTDCAGRTVFYGDAGACGKPVLETIPGYRESEEWIINERDMSDDNEGEDADGR
jgi:hypothetical protein